MFYSLLCLFVYDCTACPTRCDNRTTPQFDFKRDVAFSELIEQEVISWIHTHYPTLKATKSTQVGYPDIAVTHQNYPHEVLLWIEIKGQERTFMAITHLLKESQLQPSETVALNLSDLERYFSIKDIEKTPILLVWCLLNRPCIVPQKEKLFFYQEIDILRQICAQDTHNTRRFRRESGIGDVVKGKHKGVTINYHFSLNELRLGLPSLKKLDIDDKT
ncbi:MAG: hypothetical protein NZ551_01855 [Microscillaceae bacterium]|nr:hypothetical protein [Microscillaceae bacterium]MDW8459932.1 hypothetical protein [Cytophagales bacterium]